MPIVVPMTETITAPKIRQELGQFSREKEINRPPKKNTFAICPIVSAMAFVAVTVTSFIGLVAGVARTTSDTNQMDILTAPAVMLLVLISYYRLKDEGMEDGMTFMGEPAEGSLFTNALLMLALVIGLLTTINEILLA